MMTKRERKIRGYEMKALSAELRAMYLRDMAARMRRGLTERQAETQILTEMGCGNLLPLLRKSQRGRKA